MLVFRGVITVYMNGLGGSFNAPQIMNPSCVLQEVLPLKNSFPFQNDPKSELLGVLFIAPSLGREFLHLLERRTTVTPWKINMEHNHRGLEDQFPF